MIAVRVLYFAVARERLRLEEEAVELPDGASVADLFQELCRRHTGLGALESMLKYAVNQEFCSSSQSLQDGDEVALIPPVAGGAAHVRVTDEPLSLDEVVRAVSTPEHGGLVTFTGLVRSRSHGKNIVRLEYEAYRPMAERRLAEIVADLGAQWPGVRIAIVHRVGVLDIGQEAVVIAVSAPHRAEAFQACQAAIDRLKESVPIWKKEIADDGSSWVGLGP